MSINCWAYGRAAVVAVLALSPLHAFAQCGQTLSAGANVGTAITNAAAGTTICLNDGSYAGFTLNGVSKNPRVTVLAVNRLGATFTSQITITGGANGFTFDGVNLNYVTVTGSNTRELTFRNYNQTKGMSIDGVLTATPNILLDTFTMIGLDVSDTNNTVGIYLDAAPTGRTTPIATIRNATIDGGCADGIQSGTVFILENSRIMNKQINSCPNDPHTDALQFFGGPFTGTIVRNNYFYKNIQVLTAYAGADGVLIENNVFDPGPSPNLSNSRGCQIELYSDNASIVRHNTLVYRDSLEWGQICLDRKSGAAVGTGTIIVDNIANLISALNGSTYGQRGHNLLRSGATGTDISGAPTYIGGVIPSTMDGFALAPTSLGKGVASTPVGSDIGADVSLAATVHPNPPVNLQTQ